MKTRKQINSLTGIRGFAALWVVLHHLVNQFPMYGNVPRWVDIIADKGWLGVDLFFILSGFVISYAHQADFTERVTGSSWRRFMLLRLARIYPVHFVTTISLIPIYLTAHYLFGFQSPVDAFSFSKLWFSLSLTNGLGFADSVGWNAPSWSVSSELFAYLLFPFISLILFRANLSVLRCCLCCIAILAITVSFGWWHSEGGRYYSSWGTTLLRISAEFSIGCLLFLLQQKLKHNIPRVLAVFAVGSFLVLVCIEIPSRWDFLFILVFAALILGLSRNEGMMSGFFGQRFWVYLGGISYSIYLCHGIVFMVLNTGLAVLLPMESTMSLYLSLALYLLGTWAVAHVVYTYIEEVCRRYIKAHWIQPHHHLDRSFVSTKKN